VWADAEAAEPAASRLANLYRRELIAGSGSEELVLRAPDQAMRANLIEGSRLLAKIVPQLSESIFAHVSLIGVIDVADRSKWSAPDRPGLFESGSKNTVPASLFLSPNALRSSWNAAEALFHEGCHQKLFDLVATHSIHRPGYRAEDSVRVVAVWNRSVPGNSNEWTVDRALVAFHVYVHLGFFFLVIAGRHAEEAADSSTPGRMEPFSAARRAFDRARYLGGQLRGPASTELGNDGNLLVEWLCEAMDRSLDPKPPGDDLVTRLVSQAGIKPGPESQAV
jgi:hypothetical protein